jgi:ribonuclease D
VSSQNRHDDADRPQSHKPGKHHRKTRRAGSSARRGSQPGAAAGCSDVIYVKDAHVLHQLCAEAIEAGSYALDTEFHRERTYYPQLALIQLAWPSSQHSGLALIDPLALDADELAGALRTLLESDALAVMHAATQDLELLENLTGIRPKRLFDTQLAAGFVGYSTPSLSTLTQSLIGVSLAKGERLTDWLHRPLTENQRHYAINDVAHLHAIELELRKRLDARGRSAWADDACEELRTRPAVENRPETAWLRIKEVRPLRGEALGAAQALAAWRERKAQRADIPPRRVLSDITLVSVAQRLPRSVVDLDGLRGGHTGNFGGERAQELVDAVTRGRANILPAPSAEHRRTVLNRSVVTIINAWVGEIARREEIDASLLATRDDVENFLAGQPSPLGGGWRAQLVGTDLQLLVSGQAALRLDGGGNLVLHLV